MRKTLLFAVVILIIISAEKDLFSQIATGNTFTLEKAVVSNGGGASPGAIFSVEGTSGQSAAGQLSGATFRLQGGFWNSNLAPTAASLSISGRVFAAGGGAGLRSAVVFLTDSAGLTRTARTTTFGYYRFEGIEAGQTVILGVRSKLFQFETRVLTINQDLADVDFMPSGKEESFNQ